MIKVSKLNRPYIKDFTNNQLTIKFPFEVNVQVMTKEVITSEIYKNIKFDIWLLSQILISSDSFSVDGRHSELIPGNEVFEVNQTFSKPYPGKPKMIMNSIKTYDSIDQNIELKIQTPESKLSLKQKKTQEDFLKEEDKNRRRREVVAKLDEYKKLTKIKTILGKNIEFTPIIKPVIKKRDFMTHVKIRVKTPIQTYHDIKKHMKKHRIIFKMRIFIKFLWSFLKIRDKRLLIEKLKNDQIRMNEKLMNEETKRQSESIFFWNGTQNVHNVKARLIKAEKNKEIKQGDEIQVLFKQGEKVKFKVNGKDVILSRSRSYKMGVNRRERLKKEIITLDELNVLKKASEYTKIMPRAKHPLRLMRTPFFNRILSGAQNLCDKIMKSSNTLADIYSACWTKNIYIFITMVRNVLFSL